MSGKNPSIEDGPQTRFKRKKKEVVWGGIAASLETGSSLHVHSLAVGMNSHRPCPESYRPAPLLFLESDSTMYRSDPVNDCIQSWSCLQNKDIKPALRFELHSAQMSIRLRSQCLWWGSEYSWIMVCEVGCFLPLPAVWKYVLCVLCFFFMNR